MALPTILYNSSTGSNTAASGAGPSTALSGTNNATSSGTTVTLPAGTDLTNVATDGSHAIWVNRAGANRNISKITGKAGSGGATPTVTTEDTLGVTAVSWAIGGKRLHGENNSSRLDIADAKAGWTLWFEGTGTYDQAAAWVPAAGDTTNGGITIRGDSATTRATLRQTGNVRHLDQFEYGRVMYLNFTTNNGTNTATGAVRGVTNNGYSMEIRDCCIDTLNRGILLDTCSGVMISGCEIKNCTGSGIHLAAGAANVGVHIDGCKITDCNTGDTSGDAGVSVNGSATTACIITNSEIVSNKRENVFWDGIGALSLRGCVLYDGKGTGGHGLRNSSVTGSRASFSCYNSIFYGNAGYGMNMTSGFDSIVNQGVDYNAFGSNTSGARNNTSAGSHDVTLTADPFTNGASDDFSLNGTAGGGAACKAVGYPASFP